MRAYHVPFRFTGFTVSLLRPLARFARMVTVLRQNEAYLPT